MTPGKENATAASPKDKLEFMFFFEPCKQAVSFINLACVNSFLPSKLLVPHTVKSH